MTTITSIAIDSKPIRVYVSVYYQHKQYPFDGVYL